MCRRSRGCLLHRACSGGSVHDGKGPVRYHAAAANPGTLDQRAALHGGGHLPGEECCSSRHGRHVDPRGDCCSERGLLKNIAVSTQQANRGAALSAHDRLVTQPMSGFSTRVAKQLFLLHRFTDGTGRYPRHSSFQPLSSCVWM